MAYRPCGVCESEADEKRFHRLQADTGRVTVFAEDEVMDEFGKDFVLSILPELIADAQKRLDELKIAIDTNNYAMIEFKAHEILGPALNLMFNRLAYVAKHLEFVGKHLGKKEKLRPEQVTMFTSAQTLSLQQLSAELDTIREISADLAES